MAPLSLKIILDEGAVTRTVKFDSANTVAEAHAIIKEKVLTADDGKEYALFLTSADNERSGIWLEAQRRLDYYMLRDGDTLLYINRARNLRVKMLDGSVKTMQVDESKNIGDLMLVICGKIGITNHDEYGLCHEEEMEQEESKESKPATGTLTLKRKTQEREKDAMMEQLSKKLKTDDNVEWLDQHKTLRELGVDHKETLLLKRRLFYSDRNIDSRDPVQLNLLYVQTRDAILNGRHPVTEDQAHEFAAIQCQIHFGDFQEEKHKPGLIENLSEYLPEQYSSSWGAEKKILKLYRKHHGLSQLEAKHLYTKTARDLPTYGVTFFVVKEKQKGKKKLVPRLLGINANSILRLDEVTKEILQEWPLTHVKSYHVGKNDTFTLDFGDYSEKEYSVKTNDVYRIRDILEGYIDIIRRRLCGPHGSHVDDSGTMIHDSVQTSKANMMTHVVHAPSKVVEQSFVGPTKILPFEQGSKGAQGTQVMTVQQVIVTNKGSTQQQIVSGEVPMRSDMSMGFVKKLNGMNANAVKIVTLLTEPNKDNINEARRLVAIMEENMPLIRDGVKEAATKQTSEEAQKKLLGQLDELCDLFADASQNVKSENMDPVKAQEQARMIADLTTQIYFSLDPGTKRRSNLLRLSRRSFIEDEKTDAKLRRASFIAAAGAASHSIDTALDNLHTEYKGPALSNQELDQLELSAGDKMGKLNAAVALFLTAHSDPKNIDYAAAVNYMNTIKELLPELAEDAKALGQAQDGKSRQELMDEIKALMDAARRVCMLTGCDDHGKIQEAASEYGDVSGRLVYVFGGRNPRVNADKENEIMELAKEVGDKTTLLLVKANELTEEVAAQGGGAVGGDADRVDAAGVACADCARDLLACAQLTAPTIHEPHCQSALTAACAGLSSSAQQLATAWNPLVKAPERHALGEELTAATMELARALDRLRDAYANMGNDEDMQEAFVEVPPEQAQRLRFIANVSAARNAMKEARGELDKPLTPSTLHGAQANQLQDNISQKMAQINASVASLLQAKSDPQNPDYQTAELAVDTISELLPGAIKDCKALVSTCQDKRAQQAMLNDIRAWCDGIDDVCASSAADDAKELDDAAKKYARASKKLSFVFSPRARKAREQLMMELFDSAQKQAMQMVDDTNVLADTMGGASGGRLRDLGHAVEDSARALRNTLMVTEPTLDESRCRSALAERSLNLSEAASRLAEGAAALQDDETGCRVLTARLQAQRAHVAQHAVALQRALQDIRHVLQEPQLHTQVVESPVQKSQRLKFITSASAARVKAQEAERILEQPIGDVKLNEQQAKDLETKVSQQLADVNAAIASLIHAKTDRQNPNYESADQAIETVSDLLPQIINETKILSATCKDDAARQAMLKDLHAWCDAIQQVCANAGDQEITEFVDSAQEFADASNRLNFVFSPRKISANEQKVLQLSRSACDAAGQMAEQTTDAANSLGGLDAAALRLRGRHVRDAAQALQTTAQLTAPCIVEPRSREALAATAEALGGAAQELVAHSAAQAQPRARELAEQLAGPKQDLDNALKGISTACQDIERGPVENPAIKAQRMKFITSSATAKSKLKEAEKSLVQPISGEPLSESHAKELQDKLSQEVAQVNAAVAALVHAKADTENPDYLTAEHSISTISELVPIIVTDTKALSTTCLDDATRQNMVKDMHGWLNAINEVCVDAENNNAEEFDKATQKFIDASNKLKFVVSSHKNPEREQEVLRLSNSACQKAQQMADEASRVPAPAAALVRQRARTLTRAARALRTAAQLTAPSIHERHSQHALVPAAEAVSTAAKELVSEAQHSQNPGLKLLGEQLLTYDKELDKTLQELKNTCSNKRASVATMNGQRLKFVSSAAAVQNKAKEAEKLLERPVSEVKLNDQETKEAQEKISRALAQMNAALASLIYAKSDVNNPDYITAEKSLATISEVMPEIIKDTRDLSSTCKDDATREAMLRDIRAWCDAVQKVCASAGQPDAKDLHESALNLSNVSQKLRFVVSARKSPVKEQQIIQLSSTACDKAKQMANETHIVAKQVSGKEAVALDTRAAALSEAADAFKTTAQLTASSIYEPQCQTALMSSADALSSSARELVRQTSRAEHALARRLAEELDRYRDIMEKALTGLRNTTKAEDKRSRGAPPAVPVKRSSLSRRGSGAPPAPHSPRVRVVSHSNGRRASVEWLDHMRQDATKDLESMPHPTHSVANDDLAALTKAAEEHKRKQEKFAKIVDQADENIVKAEQELNKTYDKAASVPVLNEEQIEAIQKQMEQKLALTSNAAAKLLASNHPEALDYTTAAQSTETLSELIPDVVKDGVLLSNTRDEKSRRALLDKILALCEATRKLVGTAKNDDIQEVNEAAVVYGDVSARLLYDVCKEIDPVQEKEVINRAKEVVAGASLLAAGSAGASRDVRSAGQLAAAAGTLLYSAKLVAPSVHQQQCQNTLITAAHELSSELKNFTANCKRQSSDPQHAKHATEIANETAHLEKLLEAFRQDLAAGKLVRRRHVEKIIIEDTALRQLASQIMMGAQMRAECSSLPQNKKEDFTKYASKLRHAIRALDIANSRSKRAPYDLNKRQDLDNAVQNLQCIVLQSRPTLGDKPQNNIVDLTDFVKDTSSEAEKLLKAASNTKPTQDKNQVDGIKEECHKINSNAFTLLNPSEQKAGDDTSCDDIMEVDQFGQDCDARVERIQSAIDSINEKKVKDVLQNNSLPLVESCNLLRFATKSALATTQSAALDEALNDLNDLEKRLDKLLVPADGANAADKTGAARCGLPLARARVCGAAGGVPRGAALAVAAALTGYAAELRAGAPLRDTQHRNKLKEHVGKLIQLMKNLTACAGTRVALWQPLACPEMGALIRSVVQELENAPVTDQSTDSESPVKVLNEADLNKLLLPFDEPMDKDVKRRETVEQAASKVTSVSGTVLSSAPHPAALARAAPAAAAAACSLARTACDNDTLSPMQRRRTEEAAQEMCGAMYNMLRAAELVSREPAAAVARRRLNAAVRQLGDAVNRLTRSVPGDGSKLSRQCGEASRQLRAQQAASGAHATGAPPYEHCVRALQEQQELIHKLKSDEPLSRKEFAESLDYIVSAVCNSAELAAQSAYLISISEQHKEMAKEGLVDVARLEKLANSTQESCYRIIRATDVEMAKEEESKVSELTQELHQAIKEASSLTKDGNSKRELTECGFKVDLAAKTLNKAVNETNASMDKISACTVSLVDSIGGLTAALERPSLVPVVGQMSAETKAMANDIMAASKTLVNNAQSLVDQVKSTHVEDDDDGPMTWVTYNTHRNSVLKAWDALLDKIQRNGEQTGLVAAAKTEEEEETEAPKKSYVQIQEEAVRKWLQRRPSQAGVQEAGELALRTIIDIAKQMTEDMKGLEKEEMQNLIDECQELLVECSNKYDNDKAWELQERTRELRRAVERGVVTRAVEDALLPEPLADFDLFLDAETDESKRKFLLEKKIAELMSQLGRVTRTARLMARAAAPHNQLDHCTNQAELLAPKLVKAAEERVAHPHDKSVVDKYKALLAEYAESLSKVRDLCDRAVDPMDFVQTAGETMSRMREESSQHNDPRLCAYTSNAITRLANRVIVVSMSSPTARSDPELRAALAEAQDKLTAAMPPGSRASRLPDWKDTTAEILRTTGEVESALGGENIFKKLPEPDQPIYNAALNLHAAVREWSGRDNEIVAVAKRMAVLMARLSEQMHTERKRELIATSKSIVTESREVAALAKKMANECADVRIRTNLLQVCERIPTISGQLKMLTTVKGSSLGNQGGEEDREAMNMLVCNAQNLMSSVQEVVKAAASASVKIASQRGMKWVRKNY